MYKCAFPCFGLTPSPGWVLDHDTRRSAHAGFAETQKCALPWVGFLGVWCFVVALNRRGSPDRFQHAVTLRGRSPLALPPDICSLVRVC